MATQINSRAHEQFKIGEVLTWSNFPLRFVNRQIPDIISLVTVGSDNDSFRLRAVANKNGLALIKVGLSIKVWIYLELNIRHRHFQNPVERKDSEVIGLRLFFCCIAVEMPQDIPTLFEHLDTIRLKVQMIRGICSIFPVIYFNPDTLLHGFDGHPQVISLGRYGLKQDPVL